MVNPIASGVGQEATHSKLRHCTIQVAVFLCLAVPISASPANLHAKRCEPGTRMSRSPKNGLRMN